MKKIVTVIGARPQFIKSATVSRALSQLSEVREIQLHTGQHYDDNMSQIFLEELEIPSIDYHLSVSKTLHGAQTGEMLANIEKVLLQEKPDRLLIYGDTNSTLAGAVAAAKLHIPIAHVEAGLRSFNRKMPEEINRIVADQLSDMLFAPTREAVSNLKQEGYADDTIFEVGDVMYDAALYFAGQAEAKSQVLQRLHCYGTPYVLATIHRAENTDCRENLEAIFTGLNAVTHDLPVILPLHPRTRKMLAEWFPHQLRSSRITLIEPVGFLDMVMLEKNAAVIVTDSGGVQKEAYFHGVPCVTLRTETEWVETVALGWNRLIIQLEPKRIAETVKDAIGTKGMTGHFPYGKGDAASQVVSRLAIDLS